ncbi:HK97 family phage prohead protease [Flavobacterium sp. TR2]|uniref:HK97 family phage prohead protease n=1 Tax=Flavobacterium sp. TR2 TaxID=2977321 RepID=UPI0021B10A63|nr:HK97 family phage prohead protease [Flavobacterium sp. TR2]UWY28751.1 HK97 family phage prohead protease [Flavobacterium sp. TR2]
MKHTFLVSDETVNSYGFRILTDGIDTTRFEKNPIMLYMHDTPMVIGRWENLQKRDGKLFADAVFDEADPFAKEVMGKVERGFLKATSLGIRHDRDALLKDDNGDYLKECELIEISIVAIPSNGNALKLYTDNFDTVQLKLNHLSDVNSIATLLNLPSGAEKDKLVLGAVKTLKLENDTLKLKLKKVDNAQQQEAGEMIDLAISRRLLQPALREIFVKQFSDDFYEAKKNLLQLFPIKTVSLWEMQETERLKNAKSDKDKSEWTLEDYRKHAPNELASNPEMFKKLLKEEYKN